jgi:hypothetical protein
VTSRTYWWDVNATMGKVWRGRYWSVGTTRSCGMRTVVGESAITWTKICSQISKGRTRRVLGRGVDGFMASSDVEVVVEYPVVLSIYFEMLVVVGSQEYNNCSSEDY